MPDPILFHEPFPGVREWSVFSPAHRVELTAHALNGPQGWVVFDPIGRPDPWPESAVSAIVLTNGNHGRAAASWRERFACPVWAPGGIDMEIAGSRSYETGMSPVPGWTAQSLCGGGPGETAFRVPEMDLVVFGDAVVNLPGRGLELLPAKYCSDPTALRESLRRLLTEPFGRAVFAHGTALVGLASVRLGALL